MIRLCSKERMAQSRQSLPFLHAIITTPWKISSIVNSASISVKQQIPHVILITDLYGSSVLWKKA